MTHYFERNIVEIRNEYTDFLCSIMSPNIYEGFEFMYRKSKENAGKNRNISIITFFVNYLKGIKDLNQNQVENIANVLKNKSNCSEWFNNLVKAVIKSNIILLTFNTTGQQCDLVNRKYHETIDVTKFIHSCYIECSNIFINIPELFNDELLPKDLKITKTKIFELIETGIKNVIHKYLPMQEILKEFLKNDYINKQNKTDHIRQMVNQDLTGGNKLLVSSEELYDDDSEKKIPNSEKEESIDDIETSEDSGEDYFDEQNVKEDEKENEKENEKEDVIESITSSEKEDEKEDKKEDKKEDEKEDKKEDEKEDNLVPEKIFEEGKKIKVVKIKK